MTPTPDVIAAVLALPLEARRMLAQQPGPGWWVAGTKDTPRLFPHPWSNFGTGAAASAEHIFDVRPTWAWLPASEVAWMEAAVVAGEEWEISTHNGDPCAIIIRADQPMDAWPQAPTAPLCALAALRARFPVTP